jgi:opacity protein-like surface antigen
MLKKGFGALLCSAFLLSIQAFAQEDYTRFKNDAAVQAFGSFVTGTTDNGVHQSATNSGGVLGSYRLFFNRHNGIEVNYGYARNTQNYDRFGVNTNSHEATAAYVFRFPRRRWSPFVLAGAGALIFDPRAFSGASTPARAAFVYGAGADANLSNHLFLRAEYRGFLYNSPTYDLPAWNGLARVTHRAEPSIGFGWRF